MRVQVPRYTSNRESGGKPQSRSTCFAIEPWKEVTMEHHSAQTRTTASLRSRATALLAAALLALFVTCAWGCSAPASSSDNGNVTSSTSSQQNENVNTNLDAEDGYLVMMTIDADGEGGKAPAEYAVEMPASDENPTVLAVLEAAAAENDFDINVADSEYGAYVDSIDGIANGSAGASSGWVYTVNGESVMESAGSCTLSEGDTVEWVFFS